MDYTKYLPVDPDFYEIIEKQANNKKELNVFFFFLITISDRKKENLKGFINQKKANSWNSKMARG